MSNNPFYAVTVQNRTNTPVDFEIQPNEGPLPEQTPVRLPDGRFQVPLIQPQDEARHAALGRFMDQWSKVEMQISRLLALPMRADAEEMPVVMNALGTRGQRETLEALLLPRLNDAARQKLGHLLVALKANATKRNNLVHGYWHLEIVITERNGIPWPNYRQYRRYNPSDAQIRKGLDERTNAKARKTYMFSVARIHSLSRELDRLWHDLSHITAADLQNSPNQPINFSITNGPPITGFRA